MQRGKEQRFLKPFFRYAIPVSNQSLDLLWIQLAIRILVPLLTLIILLCLLLGWVGYEKAQEAVRSPMSRQILFDLQWLVGLLTTLGVALAVLLAVLLARSIAQPLLRIGEVMEKVKAGQLDSRVPVPSSNDVGTLEVALDRLGATFNIMADDLELRVRELSALNSISAAVTALVSLSDLRDSLLKIITQEFRFDRSLLFLVVEEGSTLCHVASRGEGFDTDVIRQLKLSMSEDQGLLTSIVRYGQPLLVPDTQQVQLATTIDLRPIFPDSAFLGVPLVVNDKVIGILAVDNLISKRPLNSSDKDLLSTIASQVALAIDGVLLREAEEQRRQEEYDFLERRIRERTTELAQANAELSKREEELAGANEQLTAASGLKSEFLANISHELRTPLNAILGFTETVLVGVDGPITPDQRESLTWVYNSGRHLLELINDVLDISKIEAGKLRLAFEEIYPKEVIQSVIETTQSLAHQKDLELVTDIAPDLPLIRTDHIRLHQILLNLVSNAIKFTDQGSVTIVAALQPDRKNWRLEVRDTGIGISSTEWENIFEKFHQVDSSSTRKTGGTGLGLAITRQLCHMLGGMVTVSSLVNQGSTFVITLPLNSESAQRVHQGIIAPVGSED